MWRCTVHRWFFFFFFTAGKLLDGSFLLQNFFVSLFVSSEVEGLGPRRLAGERKFPIVSSMDNLAVDGVLDPPAPRDLNRELQ
jgi:hypothetical protein